MKNWRTSKNPAAMLEHVRQQVSTRQLRLFTVALYRQLTPFPDQRERCDELAQLAEGCAHGQVELEELEVVGQHFDSDLDLANTGFLAADIDWAHERKCDAAWLEAWATLELAYQCSLADPYAAANDACRVMIELVLRRTARDRVQTGTLADEEEGDPYDFLDRIKERVRADCEPAAKADLCRWLREIFGESWPAPTIDPALRTWRDGSIPALAQAAYDERALPNGHLDAGRLAVLADALEEAGCTHTDILTHLRGPGPHVRGCWVVDLLLGKE